MTVTVLSDGVHGLPEAKIQPVLTRRRPRELSVLVGVPGFEPGAFRSQSGRATKLRHTPPPEPVARPGDGVKVTAPDAAASAACPARRSTGGARRSARRAGGRRDLRAAAGTARRTRGRGQTRGRARGPAGRGRAARPG